MTILFFLLFRLAMADDCTHDANTFKCVQYVKNYDADTITFNIKNVHPIIGRNISVRVRHIDTPEIKSSSSCEKVAARTAQRLVESLLKNAKRIDITNVDKDKYFRLLGDVVVDGKLLSGLLLKNNLAYGYEGGKKESIDWCKRQVASEKRK